MAFQKLGTELLLSQLHLTVHSKNNVIIPVKHGVKFLGVTTFPNGTLLPRKSIIHIKKNISNLNRDSYMVYADRYASKKQKAVIESISHEFIGK